MILRDLKEYLERLPAEYDEFELVNGQVGDVDTDDETNFVYRVDNPIVAMYADVDTREICFFHQTQEDVSKYYGKTDDNDNNTKKA